MTFVAEFSDDGVGATVTATIPVDAEPGHFLEMAVTRGANLDLPTVDGWVKVIQQQANSLTVAYYTRVATSGDSGLTFSFPIASSGKWNVIVVVNDGIDGVEAIAGPAGVRTTSSANLTTPGVTTDTPDTIRHDILVDKGNPPGTAWTTLDPATVLSEVYGTGNGAQTLALFEGNTPEPDGDVGGITYTQTVAAPQGIALTVALIPTPAGATNADANGDVTVDVGEEFTLDGSASAPAGGTYAWTQLSGATTALAGDTTATPTGTPGDAAAGTDLVYQLTYTANGDPDTDTVTVHVNPNSNPGLIFDEDYEGGADGVTIGPSNSSWTAGAGQFSDDWAIRGTRSYRSAGLGVCTKTLDSVVTTVLFLGWYERMPAAPPSNAVFARTRRSATQGGAIRHQTSDGALILLNGAAATGSASTPFTAGELARFDLMIDVGNGDLELRIFRGANIHNPAASPDETLTGSVTATEIDDFSIANLLNNVAYVREIDAVRASLTTWVGPALTDVDLPPLANAGPDATVKARRTHELRGSVTDPTGSNYSYVWTQTAGDPLTLGGSGAVRTITPPATKADETYTFQLTVMDNDTGLSDTDTVVYTVPGWAEWIWDGSGFDSPKDPQFWKPNPPITTRERSVGVVGDSLTYALGAGAEQITDLLVDRGWEAQNIRVDGLTSRAINDTIVVPNSIDVIRGWRADGFDPRVWLVALGTNNKNASASFWVARINEVCDEIASGPEDDYVIYWVGMGFKDADSRCTNFAATLFSIENSRTDFVACDWEAYIAPLRSQSNWASSYWSATDAQGVHMTALGYSTYRWPFYADSLQPELLPAPAASPTKILVASNQPSAGGNRRLSRQQLDAALAATAPVTSISRSRPVIAGSHTYSGATFPTSFAASSCSTDPADGWNVSLLNVKIPQDQWQAAATGSYDTHVTNFVNSIPAGHRLYLMVNHEPENDNADSLASTWGPRWCAMQRRIAQVIADLNDDRCYLAICHMEFTWRTSARNPDHWDPTPGMAQYVKDRTIIAPDGYQNMNADGTLASDPELRFGVVFDYFRARGWSRFAVAEHALNNNAGASAANVGDRMTDTVAPFIRDNALEFYAFYDEPGPAAGTSPYIDSPEERSAFAAICVEHNFS